MKLTKQKLQQIIKEELKSLMEIDVEAAQALMGKARAPDVEPEPMDLGQDAPEKEDVIQAALLLGINPDNSKDRMTIYNVAMLLRNRKDPSPDEIVRAIMDAREEDERIGGDETLQETLRKLFHAQKR